MAVGRISGPLLKANLLRDGVDLAFENDLLYLDVNNKRIGINTSSPTHDLQVNGTTRTTYLEATNQFNIGPITITNSNISSSDPILYLNSSTNHVVYQSSLTIDNIDIDTNVISINSPNTDLELHTSGTGSVKIYADTRVEGNIHATGNITADGDIILGDQDTDNIIFNADVNSDIIPNLDQTYSLGSNNKRWSSIWTDNFIATYVAATNVVIDGVDLALEQGNIIYVAANGSNDNGGRHQNDPVATIEKALTLATAGDTVYVYPGTYYELYPLVIPVGVTVRGASLRNTIIRPDTASEFEDVFHLNGEATVEDITIQGHYFDSINNKGYAFRFAPNFKVTTRSPYIRNVTVLTTGTVTGSLDPRGFDSGDAGKGAYIDGAVADPTTNEASMLFHSVTFLCPGVDTITMTNGARIEWLNCFTYYAAKGLYGVSGSSGIGGVGRTRLKVSNVTGSYLVGETISYYADDNTTLLASGTISSVAGGYVFINGKSLGFEEFAERTGKIPTVSGDAQLSNVQSKFGSTSLLLDGTGDYLTYASNDDFGYGTGDFTIEFWYYSTSATQQVLVDQRTQATDVAIYIERNAAGNIRVFINGAYRLTSSITVTSGAWNHIALTKDSGTLRVFVNGTLTPTTYADGNNYANKPFRIGANWVGTTGTNGYIDELRVSKGIARYTTTFVVPTSTLPNDEYVGLLLHFTGTNGSTDIQDDSVLIQDIRFSGGATATKMDLVDYTDFGCEVRSIGSACVYGDYGIYGDGDGVVMYLIGQNLAYIGLGKRDDNDPFAVVQANEVVDLNNAQIYYTSVDHKGDFRVGDLFYVNQDTGSVEFTNTVINISGSTGFTFTDGSQTTIINPSKVETGNIRISGNTVESTIGDVNIVSANDNINLLNNVNITGDLDVIGNVTIGGNITIGDNTTDSVQFVAGIDSDIIPNLPATYNIGSPSLQWKDLWVRTAHISDIEINTNYIRTTASNADLELRANGTGSILVEDIRVNQNVISSDSGNIQITPATTLDITASTTNINGDLHVTNNVSIDASTTLGTNNSDTVVFNARVNSNFIPAISNIYDLGAPTKTWQIAHLASAYIDDIYIDTNIIQTTVSNSNLELHANGTGSVQLEQTYINENLIYTVGNNLTIQPATTLDVIATATNITGDLTVTGNTTFDSNVTFGDSTIDNVVFNARVNSDIIPSIANVFDLGSSTKSWATTWLASAYIDDIYIDTNIIQTTVSNSNLELRANGTGAVRIEQIDINENVILTNGATNLIIQPATTLDITASTTNVNGDLHVTGNKTVTGNIVIGSNSSDTVIFNSRVDSNIVPTISGIYDLGSPTKAWATSYLSKVYIDDILIDTNIIQTTASNSNLELRANGTGSIQLEQTYINENLIYTVGTNLLIQPATTLDITASTTNINGDLHVTGNTALDSNVVIGNSTTDNVTFNARVISDIIPNISGFYNLGIPGKAWNISYLASSYIDDIYIDTNIIQTTVSNSNLELHANGTGAVRIEKIDIYDNVIRTNGSDNLEIRPATTLDIFANTNINGDLNVTGNVTIGGNITVGNQDTDNITFAAEINSDIIPNLPAIYNLGSVVKRWNTVYASSAQISDIEINTNVIRTTVSNADLELRANGTGTIKFEDFTVDSNVISTPTNTNFVLQPLGTGIVDINSTQALRLPRGTTAQQPIAPQAGMIRYNTTNNNYEGYDGTYWRVLNGVYDVDQNTYLVAESSPGANDNTFYFYANGIQIADLNTTRLNAIRVEVDDIVIDGNTISSVNNQNISITSAGTGKVVIENFEIKNNTITNSVSGSVTTITQTGTGYFKIDGTTGFVIPVGTGAQRPGGIPETGFMRFNTDDQRVEVYNGTSWTSAAGSSSGVTIIEAEEIAILQILMLG